MKTEERCCIICNNTEKVRAIESKMPTERKTQDLAELFKILGDPTRIKILSALAVSEMCVCDIAELLKMTQSAISHQLKSLKQARLVKSRKEGKLVFYSPDDNHIEAIIAIAMSHISEEKGV